jgi:hypothetical protein
MTSRERRKNDAAIEEERIWGDNKRLEPILYDPCKDRLDLALRACP